LPSSKRKKEKKRRQHAQDFFEGNAKRQKGKRKGSALSSIRCADGVGRFAALLTCEGGAEAKRERGGGACLCLKPPRRRKTGRAVTYPPVLEGGIGILREKESTAHQVLSIDVPAKLKRKRRKEKRGNPTRGGKGHIGKRVGGGGGGGIIKRWGEGRWSSLSL